MASREMGGMEERPNPKADPLLVAEKQRSRKQKREELEREGEERKEKEPTSEEIRKQNAKLLEKMDPERRKKLAKEVTQALMQSPLYFDDSMGGFLDLKNRRARLNEELGWIARIEEEKKKAEERKETKTDNKKKAAL